MIEPNKVIKIRPEPAPDDARMIVQLSVAELRDLIAAELDRKLKTTGPDRLVDVKEAAKMISMSEEWIYHNTKKLPFARKIGGTLRFSVNGMQKWIESNRA